MKFPDSQERYDLHNRESSFTYIRLVLSMEVSIASIGMTSLSHNIIIIIIIIRLINIIIIIINIIQINYRLHLLLITLRWGQLVPFT
jgi:hypothetical protein